MIIKKFSILIFFLVYSQYIYSQCAMCKAVVESNLENGGTKGAGLNDGILYLMTMPYIAMIIFATAYYYNKKTKNAKHKTL